MCLICQKIFSNEAMEPSKLQDHFNEIHPDKKNKDVSYFQDMKKKNELNQPYQNFFH